MNIKSIFFIAVVLFSLTITASAQKFTSSYSSLIAGCNVTEGQDGQDAVKLCNGFGGYKLRVYSSAASTHIVAEKPKTDISISVANVSLAHNETKSAVEWRMADGKPFAVIIRLPEYGEPVGDEQRGKVIGESLVVVGLSGYETKVSGEVDAKQKGANAKAREIADAAYKAAK